MTRQMVFQLNAPKIAVIGILSHHATAQPIGPQPTSPSGPMSNSMRASTARGAKKTNAVGKTAPRKQPKPQLVRWSNSGNSGSCFACVTRLSKFSAFSPSAHCSFMTIFTSRFAQPNRCSFPEFALSSASLRASRSVETMPIQMAANSPKCRAGTAAHAPAVFVKLWRPLNLNASQRVV